MEIIWQNTALVAIPNLSAVAAGVLFALDPVLAIVINNGSAIVAELNGLRPLLGPGALPALEHSLDANALLQELSRWQERTIVPTNMQAESPVTPSPQPHQPTNLDAAQTKPEGTEGIPHSLKGVSQKALAQRLAVTPQTLARRRSKSDFAQWSQTKDPERLTWSYQASTRLFNVVAPTVSVEPQLVRR